MEFEKSRLEGGFEGRPRRVWDGLVKGHRDCWVLIDRRGEELGEWLHDDDWSTPLRVCRAILDDGLLILGESDEMHAEPSRLPEDV